MRIYTHKAGRWSGKYFMKMPSFPLDENLVEAENQVRTRQESLFGQISLLFTYSIFFLVHPLLCSLSTGLNKLPPGSWLRCGRPRNCAVTSTRSAASNAAGLSSMILQSNLIQIIRFYTRQYVISRKVKFKFPAVEFKSMIPNPENGFHL